MSDRLAQLRRQRALAQEQLDWINREIAAAEGACPPTPIEEPRVAPAAPKAAATSPIGAATTADEDDIIARYRVGPNTLKSDVRKGCLLYFVAALVLLAAGVVILYFALPKR